MPAGPSRAPGAPALLTLALVLLTLLHTWWSRYALNPDGVAYLDLSARLLAGDLGAFVQGYWSPLYPALVAGVGAATSRSPAAMLTVAHLLNGAAVIAALLLLRHWGVRDGRPRFTFAALAALMLVSTGLPRIEAVTPDVLSLTMMVWLGYELLSRGGERWAVTGVVLGLAFLIKTSAWPWLLLSVPLRLWAAADGAGRRRVLASSGVAALLAAAWVVPLSVKAGRVTAGSAARLNYCWYLESCDSRTPDTHRGDHAVYRTAGPDSTHQVVWARFDESDRWTYAPWSDPTAWQAGVRSTTRRAPDAGFLLSYWGRQAQRTLVLWLLPVLLAVVIPWWLLEWSPEMWRLRRPEARVPLAVGLLGLAGVVQFIAVHAEPRLIAPPALLFVLAVLAYPPPGGAIAARPLLRQLATLASLLSVGSYAYTKLRDGWATTVRLERTLDMLAAKQATLARSGVSQDRIVVIGPGIPVMAAAYLSEAHIVAQVLPRSIEALSGLPPRDRQHLLYSLFSGMARIAWLSTPDGQVTLLELPQSDTTATLESDR